MGSTPDSGHVDLPIYHSLSDMAYSSGPSSIVSTRETSPASSTHQLVTMAASPSSFRPKEMSPSMDPYNNTFHAVGDRSAKDSPSNVQQVGRPLSSSHLYDGPDAAPNDSSSVVMGDWRTQLPTNHIYRCAESSSTVGNTSSPASKEASWNVLHQSIVNHQAESVSSRTPRMDSHNPSGNTHQHLSSPTGNQAPARSTSSFVGDQTAIGVLGSFSGSNHSRSGSTRQHTSNSAIAIDEVPAKIPASTVGGQIASIASGSFLEATHCPSRITNNNVTATNQLPTTNSEHPHPRTRDPQTLSSPSLPFGLSTSSLASPSTTARSSNINTIAAASYSSNNNNKNSHVRFATKHLSDSNNNLASPVSPAPLGTSSTFSRQYVSIASPSSRQQPTASSASSRNNNDAKQSNKRASSDYYKTNDTSNNTSKMYPESGLVIAESDMTKAMSYCYDRGDGTFTRLVPVDLLPIELADIPARVNSHKGMIVLPIPRKTGPEGQPANSQLAPQTMVTPPTSPIRGGVCNDLVQSRIDRIIGSGPVALTRGNPRREKVYCDKWVHDGTCAFTQQGCKFKHEMPADRETQMSLGLFHGPPLWWRKFQAERGANLPDDGSSPPSQLSAGSSSGAGSGAGAGSGYYGGGGNNVSRYSGGGLGAGGAFQPGDGSGALGGSWRRASGGEGPSTLGSGVGGSGGRSGSVRGGRGNHCRTFVRVGQQQVNFGPIGPPPKPATGSGPGLRGKAFTVSSSGASSSARGGGAPLNPYEALMDFGDREEDKVVDGGSAKRSNNTSDES